MPHSLPDVFQAVHRLNEEDRRLWYIEHGISDSLQREVEELLRFDGLAEDEDFFAPRMTRDEREKLVGRTIGPYQVLGLIGFGGMGSVYHAKRLKPYEHDVALKVADVRLRNGIARFHQERQLLADLQHPGVARILDGGVLEDQRPYLVMDYVPGEHIDVYADKHKLRVTERVQLWLQVCEAVSATHERGVIHRDIKPSNILVTDSGRAVVVDFGLARRCGGSSGLTQTAMLLGTPEYMSPEQAEGKNKPITPAADVYALGAVLYKLLTGRPPFRADSPIQLITMAIKDDPVSPRRLNQGVSRDLETICLKCLEKEPGKRYLSASDLVSDVMRLQRGEPIHARSISMVGKGFRWARRRPLLASLIGILFITIVASLVIVTNYWRRANTALELAKESSKQLFEHTIALKHLPAMQRPQVELFSKTIAAYRNLVQALDDEQLSLQYFNARNELIAARIHLGLQDDVQKEYSRLIEEIEAFGVRHPSLEASKLLILSLAGYAGALTKREELPLQHVLMLRSTNILKTLTAAYPERDSLLGLYADKLSHLGHIESVMEMFLEAEAHLTQSLAMSKQLYDKYYKEIPQARIRYSDCLIANWDLLYYRRGKTLEGHHLVQLASQIDRSLSLDFPDRPEHRESTHESTLRLATIDEWIGGWQSAYDHYSDSVKLNERLLKLYPDVVIHHYRYPFCLGKQGELAYAMGQQETARQHFTESMQKYDESFHANKLQSIYLIDYCRLLCEVPIQELRQIDRAYELSKQILEKSPEHPEAWINLGRCLYRKGQYAEAEKALLRVEPLKQKEDDVLIANIYLALTYAKMGQFEKARAAYAITDKHVAKYPKEVVMRRLRKEAQELLSGHKINQP